MNAVHAEIYFDKLRQKCSEKDSTVFKNIYGKKINKTAFDIHAFQQDFEILKDSYYTVSQLHSIIKAHKICSCRGTKPELTRKIYYFFFFSSVIVKIQKRVRGMLLRLFLTLFGPALRNRLLCNNVTDFVTLNELTSVPYPFFFSFENNGHIYGFHILSLCQFLKTQPSPLNPYNRQPISTEVKIKLKKIFKIAKIFHVFFVKPNSALSSAPPLLNERFSTPTRQSNTNTSTNTSTNINTNTLETEPTTALVASNNAMQTISTEWRIQALFRTLESNLGMPMNNISEDYFFELQNNIESYRNIVNEIQTIWYGPNRRIPFETMCKICPPVGSPFRYNGWQYNRWHLLLCNHTNRSQIEEEILQILERMVFSGVDHEHRVLGSFYVVGVLTLVNANFASLFPYMYESFRL